MSISDYERRKLLEKAAKLKAEKEDGSSFPTPLNLQQVQDRKMDQRLEKTQVAAKATAQATSGFAKELAAKTAKLAQEQAQRAKAKADAWRQAQDAKRTEQEEVKRIQDTGIDLEEPEPVIDSTPVVESKAPSKLTVRILASLAVLAALSGTGAWFLTHNEREKHPEQHQVTKTPQQIMPAALVQEAPRRPEPDQVVDPVQEVPETPVVEAQSKIVEPKESRKVETPTPPKVVVRFPKKQFEPPRKSEQPKTKSDWVDKANNDLDHFVEQLK
ncbi:TPA: hypothetical protein ACKP0F_000133 [Stenotrophomonas maltophilia]